MQEVTSGETFAAQAGEVLFGPAGGVVFSIGVVVAVLGCLAAVVMSAPRVYFAMARDGLFIRSVASLHPRYETPAFAIALQAVLASILVLVGSFNEIMSYFIFVVIVFIALTVIALFKLRRQSSQRGSANPGFLTPGYPITPAIFLALLLVMLVLLFGDKPKHAIAGVAVVSLGYPVYLFIFRNKRLVEKEGQF
jgi:APA family basic amino acid/polyamine antiporter